MDERESFEVECEVMKGETITKGTINFKKDGNCYINHTGGYARYESRLSEDVRGAFDYGERIHICGLDKDGVLVINYGPHNTYTIKASISSYMLKSTKFGERNYKSRIRKLYDWDRIVKIVVTNDEGLTTLREKSTEARMNNLTEEEKTIGKGDLAAFELKGSVQSVVVKQNTTRYAITSTRRASLYPSTAFRPMNGIRTLSATSKAVSRHIQKASTTWFCRTN